MRTVGKPIGTYFHPTSHKKSGRGLEHDTTCCTIGSERLYGDCQLKSKPNFIDTKSFACGKRLWMTQTDFLMFVESND